MQAPCRHRRTGVTIHEHVELTVSFKRRGRAKGLIGNASSCNHPVRGCQKAKLRSCSIITWMVEFISAIKPPFVWMDANGTIPSKRRKFVNLILLPGRLLIGSSGPCEMTLRDRTKNGTPGNIIRTEID
jgi:hypothetical protein